jgi:hypothetical protein
LERAHHSSILSCSRQRLAPRLARTQTPARPRIPLDRYVMLDVSARCSRPMVSDYSQRSLAAATRSGSSRGQLAGAARGGGVSRAENASGFVRRFCNDFAGLRPAALVAIHTVHQIRRLAISLRNYR